MVSKTMENVKSNVETFKIIIIIIIIVISSVATGSGKSRKIEELSFHTPSAGMFGAFFSLLDIGRKALAGRTEKWL